MAVALCAAACVAATAFAEEDKNGFESATPVEIADPVNPQPGMLFSAYYTSLDDDAKLNGCHSLLPKMSAAKTGVDKSDGFSSQCAAGVSAQTIRWEGFFKCKLAKTFTFLIKNPGYANSYSVKINGKPGATGRSAECSFDVDLKTGWNKIEIVRDFRSDPALTISAKVKGSVVEPTQFSPAMMFYDDKPELHPENPFGN